MKSKFGKMGVSAFHTEKLIEMFLILRQENASPELLQQMMEKFNGISPDTIKAATKMFLAQGRTSLRRKRNKLPLHRHTDTMH